MVAAVAPTLAPWATYFADNATVRAAVEAGRAHDVDSSRAERALAAAEDFADAVRAELGVGAAPQGRLALRAS
jgi:hypothetical protein